MTDYRRINEERRDPRNMSPAEVRSLRDLCDYIVQNVDSIFVMIEDDGALHSSSLAKLPAKEAIRQALRFVKEGFVPALKPSGEKVRNRRKAATDHAAS